MRVILEVLTAVLLGICTNLVSGFLAPHADKQKRLVWSGFVALIVLTVLISNRSQIPTQIPTQPTPTSMLLPPISAKGDVQIIDLSEGQKQVIAFDSEQIAIGIKTYNQGWNGIFDYVGDDIEVTVTTPSQTRSEKLRIGDCVIVKPFSVSLLDVKISGPQLGSFVITKLASSTNMVSCTIAPTPTKYSLPK